MFDTKCSKANVLHFNNCNVNIHQQQKVSDKKACLFKEPTRVQLHIIQQKAPYNTSSSYNATEASEMFAKKV